MNYYVTIGNFFEVLNFIGLFLKLKQFICNEWPNLCVHWSKMCDGLLDIALGLTKERCV